MCPCFRRAREWCSWCIDAKEYLEAHGYKFTAIDVGEDRQAYEEMKELSEQTYVPTFVAGDHVLLSPGFASFDMFRGYDDRGRHFINVVEKL